MKRSLLFCMLLGFALGLSGQDSTKVRFHVKGSETYYIQIDGQLQPVHNIHMMSRGSHNIEIWSPKHKLFTKEFETGELDSTNFVALLKIDPSYTGYVAQREQYKRDIFLMRTAPVLIATVSAASLPVLHIMRQNSHEELVKNEFYNNYNAVPSSTVSNIRRRHGIINGTYFTAIGGTVIGTAAFFMLRKKVKALEAPVFKQQNPFTLEYFEISMNRFNNSPQVGLTMNF